MNRKHFTALSLATISIALCAGSGPALADEVTLRSGESADLHAAYWVNNCKSLLKGFAGVDVLDGPAGISFAIREEPVLARRQNCPDKVPGGMVVVTAGKLAEKATVTVKYRVRYNTEDGQKQSNHSVQLVLCLLL